jgi:hypothetical protein
MRRIVTRHNVEFSLSDDQLAAVLDYAALVPPAGAAALPGIGRELLENLEELISEKLAKSKAWPDNPWLALWAAKGAIVVTENSDRCGIQPHEPKTPNPDHQRGHGTGAEPDKVRKQHA